MSFVGGSECSVNSNVVNQFNKHTQQDRSLQQQASTQQNIQQNGGFKRENLMNSRDRQNLEQFMNNSNDSFKFQPMRHELNSISHSPTPQQQVMNQPKNLGWVNDFKTSSPISQQSSQHFQQQQQPVIQQSTIQQSGIQQQYMPRLSGYRPMMPMYQASTQVAQPVAQAKEEAQVDWDNHFKEIEELTQEEAEIQREGSPEIVVDDKYQATFQEVWDGLNSEALENDFIDQQYEEFKHTQRNQFPADMNQWEKDFARYASTRAHFGDYQFEDDNQFMNMEQDPYEIGLQLMESGAKLSEAALAFEAAIQKNEQHVDAWLKLGEVQTQNEKEIAGISALEKCLELHPENSEALMNLAISYINEGYDNAAFATLERWISTKYPQISEKARLENPTITDEDRFSLNRRVTELFMNAAQLSPDQANMDPDVQMGLGVLFYANEDFDKTIDCFKAALSIKPDDPILWNRLGASLANSNRSEEAVDAYFKALSLKPTFVRARYNLGVSCINIGCYKEAAQHLLSGLSLHEVDGAQTSLNHNQSSSLSETLKRAFIALERRDLVDKVKPNMDLNQFRGEFDF